MKWKLDECKALFMELMNIMLPSFQWNLEPGYLQGILPKWPSIYDVHTEGRGSGSGGRMWTGERVQPHVDVHTEN